MNAPDTWTVLLIGGVSGTGKSTVAERMAQSLGISWFQVDDLRLALQRSQVQLPTHTEALYFFANIDEKPDIWKQDPEVLRDALISIADLLSPGLEAIIENHVDQQQPVIIEGDGIAPSLLARPRLQRHVAEKRIRSVFLFERDEESLFSNMINRGRGISHLHESDLRAEAHAKMLFGEWIIEEGTHYNLPVLEVRPWETLMNRILETINNQ